MVRTPLLLATLPSVVLGHGALVTPASRNALDRFLPAFHNGKVPSTSCSCNVRAAHSFLACREENSVS